MPRDAIHKRGLCRHAVSVCLSVRYVREFYQKSNRILRLSLPSGGETILVFAHQTTWRYSDRDSLNEGIECKWGRRKSPFSTNSWLSIDDWWSANKNHDRPPCSLLPRICDIVYHNQHGQNRFELYAEVNLKWNLRSTFCTIEANY